MSRTFAISVFFIIAMAMPVRGQCVPAVHSIANSSMPTTDADRKELASNEFIHNRQRMPNGDFFNLIGLRNGAPFGGDSERGLLIIRNGQTVKKLLLSDLPSLKRDSKYPEDDPSDSYRALAFVEGCSPAGPIEFVSFQWEGDITSPALLLTISSNGTGYGFAELPTISGGVFDISRSDARKIDAWDNLHEGSCEACLTHYSISTYRLSQGKVVLEKTRKTRKQYTSGSKAFNNSLRVRLIP
jgi:hypothetical protein